ncbi:unnamed protein product, partial [Pleuronectes platessa]
LGSIISCGLSLVHYLTPTRQRIRPYHHDQPTQHRIRHTGSTTATPGARSTNRNPWCGHRGPGSAADKAKGFWGRGIGMEKRKEKLEKEAPCALLRDQTLNSIGETRPETPSPLYI